MKYFKLLILPFILMFLTSFSLEAQVNKGIFYPSYLVQQEGFSIKTELKLDQAFAYTDSIHQETVYLSAVRDSLTAKVAMVEQANEVLSQRAVKLENALRKLKAHVGTAIGELTLALEEEPDPE